MLEMINCDLVMHTVPGYAARLVSDTSKFDRGLTQFVVWV